MRQFNMLSSKSTEKTNEHKIINIPPTNPVTFHLFTPVKKPTEFSVTVEIKEDFDVALAQFKNFLEQKEIANTVSGEIVGASIESIRFPNLDEIKKISAEGEKDSKECFKQLEIDVRLALIAFLKGELHEFHKDDYSFRLVKPLFALPLRNHFQGEIKKLLDRLEVKLKHRLSFNLNNGKIVPTQKLIAEGVPTDPLLLRDYLHGVAFKLNTLDPKLVELLIKNGSAINLDGELTPLMLLFSRRYEKKCQTEWKETLALLLQNKASIDTTHDEQTAYDIAHHNDYPNSILNLIRPASKKRCGCF